MNDVQCRPAMEAPERWWLVFHLEAVTPWVDRLVPGKYKHVSAFGFCRIANAWIFFDPSIEGTKVRLVPDGDAAVDAMSFVMNRADCMLISPVPARHPAFWFGGWCTRSIARLIGRGHGALRPDALWRKCLPHAIKVMISDTVSHEDEVSISATRRPADQGGAGSAEGAG